jgi:hypothetical protein
MTQLIGHTKESLYEFATTKGMHPGCANQLVEFAMELQRLAIEDQRALQAQNKEKTT